MNAERSGEAIAAIVAGTLFTAVVAWVAMLTFGSLAIDVPAWHLPPLGFWQCFGALFVLRFLVGGWGSGKSSQTRTAGAPAKPAPSPAARVQHGNEPRSVLRYDGGN